MKKTLTDAQKELLEQAGSEWRKLPGHVGCANRKLLSLERRCLVEVRYVCGIGERFGGDWYWRATGAIA